MIYDISPVNNYKGNNLTTKFDFNFYIDNEDQLKVYLYDENNIKIELKNNVDYRVDEIKNKNGSFITFPISTSQYEVLKDNQNISLELDLPISQETQYNNSSLLNLEALEYSFDYLTRLIQILKRKLSLCVTTQECSDVTPQELMKSLNNAQVVTNELAQKAKEEANTASKKVQEANDILNKISKYGILPDNITTLTDPDGKLHAPRHDLFDLVSKDHILSFEESYGLARLGSLVYKEGVPGTRYGYSDFYNTCLKEYKDETNEVYQKHLNVEIVGNPKIDLKTGDISQFSTSAFANMPINLDPSDKPWRFKWVATTASSFNTTAKQTGGHILGDALNAPFNGLWVQIFGGKIGFDISSNGTSWMHPDPSSLLTYSAEPDTKYYGIITFDGTKYEMQISKNDESNYTVAESFESSAIKFTKSNSLGITTCDTPSGPWGGILHMDEWFFEVDGQIVWKGADDILYQNKNKHIFYDIKEKEKIDEIYSKTGIAWFYGIDEVNERILLPRNDYFFQNAADEDCSKYIEAGLPKFDITLDVPLTGIYHTVAGGTARILTGYTKQTVTTSVYGNSTTVQPPSSGVVTYMVVGNTFIPRALSDVIDVSESQNDTIPLFTGQYFDFKPNHLSWVKAGTYADGKVYKSAYNELIKILNGQETKYGEGFKVIEEKNKQGSADYSEYWIVNQENETFRVPLKTSLLNTIQNARILIEKKEPTEEDKTWYNLYSDGWLEQGDWGLPLDETKGEKLVTLLKPYKDKSYEVFASSTVNNLYASAHVESENEIKCETRGHDFTTQPCHISWITKGYAQKPTVDLIANSQNTNLYFKIANAVENLEIIDAGELLEEVNSTVNKVIELSKETVNKTECKAYVIQTYTNGASGYRIYSDGYCQQWGTTSNGSWINVVLLKTYNSTNYNVTVGGGDSSGAWCVSQIAAANMIRVGSRGTTTWGSNPVTWRTCGYLAQGEY